MERDLVENMIYMINNHDHLFWDRITSKFLDGSLIDQLNDTYNNSAKLTPFLTLQSHVEVVLNA